MISDRDLDATASPQQIKEGAALWAMVGIIGGGIALWNSIGWLGTLGVAAMAAGAYFAAVHTIYDKIKHFKAAVKLWNEVEKLQQKEIDHDQRP